MKVHWNSPSLNKENSCFHLQDLQSYYFCGEVYIPQMTEETCKFIKPIITLLSHRQVAKLRELAQCFSMVLIDVPAHQTGLETCRPAQRVYRRLVEAFLVFLCNCLIPFLVSGSRASACFLYSFHSFCFPRQFPVINRSAFPCFPLPLYGYTLQASSVIIPDTQPSPFSSPP